MVENNKDEPAVGRPGDVFLFPSPERSVPAATATTHLPQKSGRRKWLLGLAILIFCCCPAACANLFARIETERPLVESVLDDFMQAMAAKDADRAYALFSSRAKRVSPLAGLEELLEGNNYALFEGYRQATVTDFSLNFNANADPNGPQGTVAEVEGTVAYEGDFTGSFTAVLEKENGVWRLFNIYITVSPEKIN